MLDPFDTIGSTLWIEQRSTLITTGHRAIIATQVLIKKSPPKPNVCILMLTVVDNFVEQFFFYQNRQVFSAVFWFRSKKPYVCFIIALHTPLPGGLHDTKR